VKRTLSVVLTTFFLALLSTIAIADVPAPAITIASPQEGVTLASDSVTVTGEFAAGDEALVEQVELLIDGTMVQARELDPAEAGGAVTFVWAARRHGEGEHQVALRAVDSEGRVGEAEISVWVTSGRSGSMPRIRIASHRSGEEVSGRTEVQVVSDRAQMVSYVIFLVDDVFKAMTNVRPFVYGWDTTRYLNGLHTLRARAYLEGGSEVLSPVVEVNVDNPSGATSMREPQARAMPKVAPEPMRPPARAGQPNLPPPMRAESPAAAAESIIVAEAEMTLPGTAPFLSPAGELIRPPAPLLARRSPGARPVQVAVLPSGASYEPTGRVAAGPTIMVPAAAVKEGQTASVKSPVSGELPAGVPKPSVEPLPALKAPSPRVEAEAQMPAPSIEAPRSDPVRSSVQVAMLPPRPAERVPQRKLAPEPIAATREMVYLVRPGDCLWQIAADHCVSPKELAQANDLADPDRIRPGQQLRIPCAPVYFDNRPLESDVPAFIAHGRAIVAFRPVIEEAGGSVVWDASERRARALARGHDLAVTIGSDRAQVDGDAVAMSAPAALRNDRTVVPLRFLGDALDLALQYQDGVIHIASWH
jgi:nucleoid-associated protein YgaU